MSYEFEREEITTMSYEFKREEITAMSYEFRRERRSQLYSCIRRRIDCFRNQSVTFNRVAVFSGWLVFFSIAFARQ